MGDTGDCKRVRKSSCVRGMRVTREINEFCGREGGLDEVHY